MDGWEKSIALIAGTCTHASVQHRYQDAADAAVLKTDAGTTFETAQTALHGVEH